MAEIGHALVERKIPFVIEKPGGINAKEVAGVRDAANAAGLHAGAGFNFRTSDLYDKLVDIVGDDPVTHASFRYIAGGPYRYRADNSAWMLDPARSGGGSTINLSVHFIDMFRTLSRSHPTEVTSLMGNYTWELPIEDYSSLIMRSPTSVCTVETGYTYPVRTHGIFDLRFSIRTTRHYLIVRNDNVLQVQKSADGALREYQLETSNLHMYPDFVTVSVDRFAKGLPPVASLDDLTDVVRVVDAAFASSKRSGQVVDLGGA
jgi:predicted dehydrogenase